ncbi:hypothetical protein PG991_001844 [Apiospora marii]|uniref:RRM domain-containing protein n=1 Tax=Apiospora marii TaxID=335849 RepID=A0ABR1SN70_9PEZI
MFNFVDDDERPDYRLCDAYVASFDEREAKILEIVRKQFPGLDEARTQVRLPRVRRCNNSLEYPVDVTVKSQTRRFVVVVPEDPGQIDIDDTMLEVVWEFAPQAVKDLAPLTVESGEQLGGEGVRNPLGRPWMLVGGREIRGLPLSCVYDRLSREQKVAVAGQLGRVYREVQGYRQVGCGYPDLAFPEKKNGDDEKNVDGGNRGDDEDKKKDVVVRLGIRCYHMTKEEENDDRLAWDDMTNVLPETAEDGADSENDLESADELTLTRDRLTEGPRASGLKSRQILILQLRRWIHYLHYRRPADDEVKDQIGLLQCALHMAREIIARNPDVFDPRTDEGEEGDDRMCFHNPYLGTPENIMVEFLPGHAEPTIRGIFDWGASAFDPHFAACRPPSWLWRSSDPSSSTTSNEDEKAREREAKWPVAEAGGAPQTFYVEDPYGSSELTTVRIGGLPEGRPGLDQEAELCAAFSRFGRIAWLHAECDLRTGLTRRGWGTVTYVHPADAAEACRRMHGQLLPRLDYYKQKQPQEVKDQEKKDDEDHNDTTTATTTTDDNDKPPKISVRMDITHCNDTAWKRDPSNDDEPYDPLAEDVARAHAERASLWYDRHGDEPLDLAQTQPTDPDGEAIQRAFDEAVGGPFRRVAYNPDMAFARNLYTAVRDRPWRPSVVGHNLKVIEGLVAEWYEREAQRAASEF